MGWAGHDGRGDLELGEETARGRVKMTDFRLETLDVRANKIGALYKDELAELFVELSRSRAAEDSLRAELLRTQLERDEARAAVRIAHGTDVWFWQGDGYDNPESLACPVVMSADTLREFVAARAQLAALVEALPRCECDDCNRVALVQDAELCYWCDECRRVVDEPTNALGFKDHPWASIVRSLTPAPDGGKGSI